MLTVQRQNGVTCAWFAVDPEAPKCVRSLAVVGTGHIRPKALKGKYISTVQVTPALVFHLFDMGEDQ